ncbi:hypothetical protein [Pedobacter antarcticus]|uniref:hypothetical protein n=1 Tax=Pedobacter antarcticus TaxID=34086 RepID=UPI002930EF25|nr:hypothetical protein [Pedobacter antarcticus]
METKIDFEKLRKQLPFGAQTEIAKIANVHISLVNRVLYGKSQNTKVLNAIADFLTMYKEQQQTALNKLASFID